MGRRPYHGTVKGEPENETKIIDAAVMKEWIKKAKKLRKGRWYDLYRRGSQAKRPMILKRKLIEHYEYHALFLTKKGRRECFTYAELAQMIQLVPPGVKPAEEKEEWEDE